MTPPPIPGLNTPPETPIEQEIPREEIRLSPTVYAAPTAPALVMVGGIGYPLGQLRVMADELAHARRNGEFPQTSLPSMDAQSIVEDYQGLLGLRATRGSHLLAAPEAYKQLHASITHRVRERDASLSQDSGTGEVARRSSAYLRSIEQERRFYEAANSMLQRRGIAVPTQLDLDSVSDEICDIVEKSVEHMEQCVAEANEPLQMNVGRLRNETIHLREQNREQNQAMVRQIDLHNTALERLSDSIDASRALLGPQSTNLQTMTQNLGMASDLVGHLSQLIFDMPIMINQAVSEAVHNQAGVAIREVMDAQQEVMVSLHKESVRSKEGFEKATTSKWDVENRHVPNQRSRNATVGRMEAQDVSSWRMTARERGKLRRMFRKVMKRKP